MNWKKLSYKKKNGLLLVAMVLVLLLSWNLAFRNTYNAFLTNQRLSVQAANPESLAYHSGYLQEKNALLDSIVQVYTADSAIWHNSFWMNVGKAVPSEGIRVIYQAEANRNAENISSGILQEQISFESDFRSLLVLLDTLDKQKETGYINSVSFVRDKSKRTTDTEKLRMRVVFGVVGKE